MKKVVTINLGGNAYQLDDDGYDALTRYLDGASARLKGNPDLDEIMSDLELAIADKAKRFLGPAKSVVSGSEIEQIIEEMGPVDMPPGDEDESGLANVDRPSAESALRGSSKLYRLTGDNEKTLAGVCAGLAAHFGLDVSIVRILFVALAIATAGVAIVGYLLLMLIVPAAETPEQRAAAFGLPFDAQDVIDRAKTKFSALRDAGGAGGSGRTDRRYPDRYPPSAGRELFRWLLAAVVIGVGVVVGIAFSSGLLQLFGLPFGMVWPAGYYGYRSLLPLVALLLGIALVLAVFGRRSPDRSSFRGSSLLVVVLLILILGLLWSAMYPAMSVLHIVGGNLTVAHGLRG